MQNFMRYFRQNKERIIRIAIFIAFLILILQILNNWSKNNKDTEVSANVPNIYNSSNGTIRSDRTMVSGGSVSRETLNETNNIVENFVDRCNNGKVEEAYNMISNACKEVLYPNYEMFYNNYYKNLFENNKRTYSIENWSADTYVVKYTKDILSTGKTLENATYQDYITIVTENNEKKLNINKFIGRNNINKTSESDNIKTEVLYKDMYMDYEIYTMKILNNTENPILMDALKKADGIFLKDDKQVRHQAFSNELIKDDLKIYVRTYQCYYNKV